MPEFDYYMAISALKHAMLAIRDDSNGKTLGAPEALPNFAMEHLALYIDRHKSRVSAQRARLFSIQRASFSAIAMNGSACGPSNAAGGCPASEAWRIAMSSGRSEGHTSELQSLMRNSYAVFCLKKKHTILNNKQ